MSLQRSVKIHIEYRTLIVWLSMAVICLPFSFAVMGIFGLDDVVKLGMDAIWLTIILIPLIRKQALIPKRILLTATLVGTFFLYTLVVYVFRHQSALYYLWGLRNNFRFYVVFIAVTSCFHVEEGYKCLDFFDVLFWAHIAACFIQFFMGYQQDYLGGIFGVSVGCNGYMITYLTITVSRSVLEYMNGNKSFLPCFLKCIAALTVAALAELKFFFFIFILILGMAMFLTSFSFRKVALFGVSAVLVSMGAFLLGTIHESFEGFLSIDTLQHALSLKNYATGSDMGRFNAIDVISQRFLQSLPDRLFGLGLGNCDESSIAIFNTPFFDAHGNTHYGYFSYAFMFIENGYIGLALYVLFFVICLVSSASRLKNGRGERMFCQLAVIISVVCFLLLFYNSSLRMETGYMIYFVLALAFLESEKPKERIKKNV